MMDTHGNSELLDEFVRTGDQKVLAALVLRHVDLVYTAARRQVRDPHLAEDVAQAVFLALSRKAGAIGSKVVLEGWLLNATRFAARDALRKESRRLRHETAAAQERNHQVQLGVPFAPTETERLEHSDRIDAALDSALARLASSSPDALLLRFFQNKSFRDVGAEPGIGEDAAKQRVFRGLRQLRKILLKSGLELPLEGLGAVLVTRGILPAPPDLARAILSQAGKTASAAIGSSSVGNAATTIAAWTKAKVAAVLVTGVLVLGGGVVMVAHHVGGVEKVVVLRSGAPSPARTTPAAAGPAPGTVTSWGVGIQPSQTIAYAGPPLIGTVYDPAGNALADADVIVSSANYAIWVFPPLLADIATGAQTKTSQTGHFELTPKEPPIAIAARATAGFAAVLVSDPAKPISITLRPWARLQGTVRRGGKPVPRALVQISQFGSEAEWNRWHIVKAQNILCDDRGLFIADRVVPGINQIGLVVSKFTTPQRTYAVDLTEGKTAPITIGDGRTLTGRLPLAAKAFRHRLRRGFPGRRYTGGDVPNLPSVRR
ncbi:MAG TPA: sigma-70 family RNA polymerase sigma factor [Tepidisphaeraceae bacterium]|nr:sigma-70 family RNA polymerase sigma factor [Tepidisphaeraceae bacterium]